MAEASFPRIYGRFRVLARLGAGGMGEVFLAIHEAAGGFKKRVALKRLLPHLVGDGEAGRSFLDEASLLAQLSHPNVCEVYSLEEIEGQHYIEMEFLEGLALDRLIAAAKQKGRSLPLPFVSAIFAQTCEGLHYAHEIVGTDGRPLRLIHRDISPHNLFVTYQGVAKLLDFGIAKTSDSSSKTATGAIKGKTAYMSPEQVRSQPLDRRSDIFSLGVSLYEALALANPFRRESMFETVQAIATASPPPLAALRPDAGEKIVALLDRALAAEPDRRFGTADEMRTALLEAAGVGARPWGRDDVAAYLREEHTATLREHKAQLARWTARAESADESTTLPDARPAEGDGVDSGHETRPFSSDPFGETDDTDVLDEADIGSSQRTTPLPTHAAPASEPPRPSRRRAVAPILAAAIAVAAAATWYFGFRKTDSPAEPVLIYREPTTRGATAGGTESEAAASASDGYARVLATRKSALLACFREHATEIEGAPELHLLLELDAEGRVQHAGLEPQEIADTPLGICLGKIAVTLEFAPTGKLTTVKIPLRIEARH